MKLFVDTGSIKDIEAIAQLGILDGVTTNPSLLAKEPGDFRQNLKRICDIVKGPVSGEVTATDFAGMMREGHDLAGIDPHVVVKVPLTRDGIKACKALSSEGIRVNVTLCFSAAQALLAAKVGASFISPFVGRLDDIATSGMELVREIVEIYSNYDFTTEVLVASCRHPMHVVEAARMGADMRTGPPPARGPPRRDRCPLQPSAHEHRPGEIPERLGESSRGQGLASASPRHEIRRHPGRPRAPRGVERRRGPSPKTTSSRQAQRPRTDRASVRPGYIRGAR